MISTLSGNLPSASDIAMNVENIVKGIKGPSNIRSCAPMEYRLGVPIDQIMYTKHMKHQTLRNV